MLNRSILLLLLSLAAFATFTSHADPPVTPAVVTVSVTGVQPGVTVMAYWLEQPLFERDVPTSPSEGTPFVFTVEASPGTGQLKVWSFHKARGGGGAALFRPATFKPGLRYTLSVSPEDGYRLQFTVAEEK